MPDTTDTTAQGATAPGAADAPAADAQPAPKAKAKTKAASGTPAPATDKNAPLLHGFLAAIAGGAAPLHAAQAVADGGADGALGACAAAILSGVPLLAAAAHGAGAGSEAFCAAILAGVPPTVAAEQALG